MLDRFLSKIQIDDNICWNYTSAKDKDGYGIFALTHRKSVKAHRLSYEIFRGKIPDGLTIDHLCRNRACCNPEHLEPVTMGENTRRGNGITSINARKTHCIHGHPFSGENLRVGQNRRFCRTCDIIKDRAYKQRQKQLRIKSI